MRRKRTSDYVIGSIILDEIPHALHTYGALENGPCSFEQLYRKLHCSGSPAFLSTRLYRGEKAGLVALKRGDTLMIELTPYGLEVLRKARELGEILEKAKKYRKSLKKK